MQANAIVMTHNLIERNSTPGVSHWREWSHPKFIEKNSRLLFTEVYESLDYLLTVGVRTDLTQHPGKAQKGPLKGFA